MIDKNGKTSGASTKRQDKERAMREHAIEAPKKDQKLNFPYLSPSSKSFTMLCGLQEDGSCTLLDCPNHHR